MPRTEAANQRIRNAQRAKILAAAWAVFAHKGRAATMADVAAAADVSYGLAYRHFANKETLYQALVQQSLQSSAATVAHFLERPGTPGERLSALVTGLVDTRRAHPEYSQLLGQVLGDAATPPDLLEQALRVGRTFQDLLRQLIVEGQATGEVRPADPDELLTAVLATLDGLSRLPISNPDRFHHHYPEARIIVSMLIPPR